MRSTSGGSYVDASTRTLRSVIQCDSVVTTVMAEVGAKRQPPRTVAYRWWVVYAISTVAFLLVSTEGPQCRLGVRH